MKDSKEPNKNNTKMRAFKFRRGMTLIEALIGLVIMSMLIAGLLSFYAKGQQDFFNGNVRSDVLDKARYPLSWIGRDANVSFGIRNNHETWMASSTVLVLKLPALDASGYVINDIAQYDDIVYYVSDHRLIRHCHPWPQSFRQGGDKILADNVAGLAVIYYDADENVLTSGYTAATAVKAEVTISTTVGSRNFRQPLSSRFTLRNKAT